MVVVAAVEPSTTFACSSGTTEGQAAACCCFVDALSLNLQYYGSPTNKVRGKNIEKTGSRRFVAARDELTQDLVCKIV